MLRLQFLPDVHFSKWQASKDSEWAVKVGLFSLCGRGHQPIREELIYDFVEGYDGASNHAKVVSIV